MANTRQEEEIAPAPGDSYVQSFARGLQVIRSFSATAPRQTLSEVAAATGLTRAGARRILLTLQALGYVETDGKRFGLTARILELGFAYLSSMPIWNRAEPVMEALVRQVKESCSAAVLDGTDIVYVLRVQTHKIMRINLAVGTRLPAYCTSLGRMLLADLDDAALLALAHRHPPAALTEHTRTDPQALIAAVRTAQRQGFAVNDRELETGLVSIAAPIFDRAGRTVAALNVGAAYARDSIARLHEDVLPELLSAARDISALLQRT